MKLSTARWVALADEAVLVAVLVVLQAVASLADFSVVALEAALEALGAPVASPAQAVLLQAKAALVALVVSVEALADLVDLVVDLVVDPVEVVLVEVVWWRWSCEVVLVADLVVEVDSEVDLAAEVAV